MKIVEKFLTLQGEGKYLGVPSYFIRSTGCNLRCAWKDNTGITYCDTPYTSWQAEKGEILNTDEVLRFLRDKPIKHIVITGGEPMIQPDIATVVNEFIDNKYLVTVETNGTVYRTDMSKAFMSLSPKLESSYAQDKDSNENRIHKRNNCFYDSIEQWMKSNPYQLKFVVNDAKDLIEILELQKDWGLNHSKIYLMPQGITREQLAEKSEWLFKTCEINGFNFSPRMHIDIWGNRRGI